MKSGNKCYCDLYKACEQDPTKEVSISKGTLSAEEFTAKADQICPGTRVYLASVALNSENIVFGEDDVTLPKEAIKLECRFFREYYGKM